MAEEISNSFMGVIKNASDLLKFKNWLKENLVIEHDKIYYEDRNNIIVSLRFIGDTVAFTEATIIIPNKED